jgi:hypothetical protein
MQEKKMQKYFKYLIIISLFIFSNLVFAQKHEIEINQNMETQQKRESMIATTSMLVQGTIVQDKHNRVFLKIFDNYSRKFYSLILNDINPQERKCLRPNHSESTNKIFLYQARQPLMFTQQIHDITIKGVYKNTYFKKLNADIIKESVYSVKLKAPELTQMIQSNYHKFSYSNKLQVIIASSTQSIKTKKCY